MTLIALLAACVTHKDPVAHESASANPDTATDTATDTGADADADTDADADADTDTDTGPRVRHVRFYDEYSVTISDGHFVSGYAGLSWRGDDWALACALTGEYRRDRLRTGRVSGVPLDVCG
jgi:hypothetical protein